MRIEEEFDDFFNDEFQAERGLRGTFVVPFPQTGGVQRVQVSQCMWGL